MMAFSVALKCRERLKAINRNACQNASIIRRLSFSSGRRPRAASRSSSRCARLFVAGIAHVTAGCARIHFRKNWAHEVQSSSAAHGGSGRERTRLSASPPPKGRFTRTATPLSRGRAGGHPPPPAPGGRAGDTAPRPPPPAEGRVRGAGDPPAAGEGEDPLLGPALGQRVVHLEEIELLPEEHALDLGIGALVVIRDADVADRSEE